jgi:hypothetical protein
MAIAAVNWVSLNGMIEVLQRNGEGVVHYVVEFAAGHGYIGFSELNSAINAEFLQSVPLLRALCPETEIISPLSN